MTLTAVPVATEPAVMVDVDQLLCRALPDLRLAQMATLGVHEAMGARVDRAATATLVLPQLWAMSMGSPRRFLCGIQGPLEADRTSTAVLNVDQFSRFMT